MAPVRGRVQQIDYADLIAFDTSNSSTKDEMLKKIEAAYGPEGLGILEIMNVPDFEQQREQLLPLAARLPHLPDLDALIDEESMFSIGWSHGKEVLSSGQPDTAKGSFYAKPMDSATRNRWPTNSMPKLQSAFIEMCNTLQDIGCRLGHLCDAYCAFRGVQNTQIAASLHTSHNATGRLLHYFAVDEHDENSAVKDTASSLWCAWHNDHVRLLSTVLCIESTLTHSFECIPA